MRKEFVPYEQAVALRNLGFDYGCLAQYGDTEEGIGFEIWNDENFYQWENSVSAPLYQQAFRWFREKHGLWFEVYPSNTQFVLEAKEWFFIIKKGTVISQQSPFKSYEEAQQALLERLIQYLSK